MCPRRATSEEWISHPLPRRYPRRVRSFDLIIIGAGSGNSVIGPEHDDLDIAIVERGFFGGTCLNVGCIPSKMLVYAAEVAELASRVGPALGVHTRSEGADWPAIRDRVFGRIDPIVAGGEQYRRSLENVTVFKDDARFVGPKELLVGDEVISAQQLVLAAGARSFVPDIPGLADIDYHTSDTIMRVDQLPDRLLVIGGGYIATELGHVFSAYGSDVTFVLRSDKFLRAQDDAISHRFTEIYTREYDVKSRSEIHSARCDDREIVLDVTTHGERMELKGDALLVATGRIPNGDQLDLATTGVATDDAGYVITDDQLRTNVDGIWALGDITNPIQLKHVANHEAKVVAHNLVDRENPMTVNHRFIPHAVFGHPQVAGVGLTERDCISNGRPYISHVQEYCSAAYGWAMEDTDSFVKLIADPHTRHLIGAHIIGPQAPTLIQQLIQGMAFDLTIDQMAHGQYYIHPGLPEVVEQALLEM